jgi:hypothetical protein
VAPFFSGRSAYAAACGVRLAEVEAVEGWLRGHLVRALRRGLAVAGCSAGGDHVGAGG